MSGGKIKAALTALICTAIVLCFAFIIYTGTTERTGKVGTKSVQVSKTISKSNNTTFTEETEESNYQSFEEYINETVFIGDSRTNGLAVYNFIPGENVLAKDGENHRSARTEKIITAKSGKAVTIAEAVAEKKPTRMIVSFGINGVSFMEESSFMEDYSALLDDLYKASPYSIIIVQSILPVSKSFENARPTMSNAVIDRYNALLKELAGKKGFGFLDSSAVLKDKNNCLDEKYDSGDGLHFNKAAYEALLQFYNKNRIG